MARMFALPRRAPDYEFVICLSGKARGWLPRVHPTPTTIPAPLQPEMQRTQTMNAKTLIATALVLSFAGAGAAFAQEGTQDFPAPKYQAPAKLTRSEVIATLKAAPAAEATANEASPAPQAVSTLSRAQVQAEAREALRLGLVGSDDGMVRVATPAQLEQIRAAGLRAIDNGVTRAAK
jgi:hypothetical protein